MQSLWMTWKADTPAPEEEAERKKAAKKAQKAEQKAKKGKSIVVLYHFIYELTRQLLFLPVKARRLESSQHPTRTQQVRPFFVPKHLWMMPSSFGNSLSAWRHLV